MSLPIGSRVGAILSEHNNEVQFLGYGVYEGDFVPTSEAAGFMAEICREMRRENPRILLDNGKRVYGCECWWGSEQRVQEVLKGKKVVLVDITAYRPESPHDPL